MNRHFSTRRTGGLLIVTLVASVLVLDTSGTAAPTPMAPDALLENQWHLMDRAKEVGGANVRAAWPSSLGAGIVIGIVDDGVQYSHPDLSPNYLAAASYDFNFNDADPQPFSTSAHGTAVAGVAAARGDNSIGVAGVAPQASIAALRLTAVAPTDAQEASAFGFQPNVIHILNNSWSPADNGTTLKGPGTQAAAARNSAATTGRSGKGRIFVQQSGNGRLNGDDCNFDGYANNRFVISVGSLNDQGVQSSFSEGCSALMIVAPSGGGQRNITTTDLIATPGYDGSDYTNALSTTSASAPAVSGAVALMLARNPNLTWRDVQHILRRTAVRILPTDVGWTTGTFRHNERLGFGLLDTDAAVDMAANWTNVPAEEVLTPATRSLNLAIPDINQTGISDSISISSADANFMVEHIEVEFDATHPWRGDLQIKLTSPTGVVSFLAPIRPTDSGDNFPKWKFGSVRHWGESASGRWTLNVADRRFQDAGTWNNWTLRIYGYRTAATAPGTFTKSSPANGAGGQVTSPTLSWSASSGAAGYDYCYDTSNDGACANWIASGLNTSVGLSGLSAGATYYWHVRAFNAVGTVYANGASSAFWSFTTGSAPAAFAKSNPAGGASGQSLTPTLTWTSSAGASSYDYCYDTTNDNACANWIGAGLNTSAALSGLSAGVAYYWQVRANSAAGITYANGAASAFWGFTTVAAPGAFVHSSPSNGATGQSLNPTLSWSASSGVANYDYCYDTTNDNACSNWQGAGASTSVNLSGLSAGTVYYWQVRAVNGGGTTYANGALSAFWSFTPASAPGAFVKSSPANGATGLSLTPTISWTSSAGATSYDYCYDTSNDNACSGWTGAGGSTSANLSGLAPGTAYYWQVRANSSGGTTYANGAATSFWNFTTIALPGAFAHSSPSNGASGQSSSVTLAWTTSSGAANYSYCFDATNDNECSNWQGAGASTSVGVSGLTPGATYYWQVRATNGGGTTYANGAATAYWSFRTKPRPEPIVDLDGDGNGDVFTYNPVTGAWARQVTKSNGGFTTTTGSWNPGWTVVAANLNTDALTDMFLFNPISGQWFKMLNSGNGFTTQSSGSWWQGWQRHVMDLDGDGISDFFLYDPASGQWFKAISTPDGFAYTQGAWNAGWEIYPMTLDADAMGDMFLIDRRNGRWFWVLSEAGAGFKYPLTETWFPGWQFYPGDFNGDGLTDVLLHDPQTGTIFVASANATGYTYSQGGWSLGWTPAVADLNADGKDDLFLHDTSTGAWFELTSNGDGKFTNAGGQTWSMGWKLHFTDVNGDGRGDVILYDPASGAWYQARNFTLGSFTYANGTWQTGLTIVVRAPNR